MKNLHHWALISEDAAMLAVAKNEDLPNVLYRLRKYKKEDETLEACLPVFAAIIALTVTFPEILKVSFKSQETKAEWAAFCKMQGWCDLSGRVQKPMKAVSMESGSFVEVGPDTRLDPPARQAWLPWTAPAEGILQALKQAYAKTPRRIACPEELAMGYGASEKTAKELGEQLHEQWANGVGSGIKKCWDESQQTHKEQTMNLTQKASAFFGNLKSVGLDLLRVQRGRATLHSAKRVIFAALPIKWGFLARLTGKAKKVENHPLTDLGLALALHGATNFAISDPVKREKYLKYTEEMLVAAGYSVSLKMLPVEDMLDKIFAGVGESEAMSKLKELVKDSGEPEIKVKQ